MTVDPSLLSPSSELIQISLKQIRVNPHQPRREFDEEDLLELSQSIQNVGLLHPPLVRPHSIEGIYELVSGERRFRAAQLAGFESIPVIVQYSQPNHSPWSAQAALIENIQRIDLNPLEVAHALQSLIKEHHWSQEELAEKIGKKRSTIANYLRLLTLPERMQQAIIQNKITMGHGKALLVLTGEHQERLFNTILKDKLSVRETERQVYEMPPKRPRQDGLNSPLSEKEAEKKEIQSNSQTHQDIHLLHIESLLATHLGTRVKISNLDSKGEIKIEYTDWEDLERLLDLMGKFQSD